MQYSVSQTELPRERERQDHEEGMGCLSEPFAPFSLVWESLEPRHISRIVSRMHHLTHSGSGNGRREKEDAPSFKVNGYKPAYADGNAFTFAPSAALAPRRGLAHSIINVALAKWRAANGRKRRATNGFHATHFSHLLRNGRSALDPLLDKLTSFRRGDAVSDVALPTATAAHTHTSNAPGRR